MPPISQSCRKGFGPSLELGPPSRNVHCLGKWRPAVTITDWFPRKETYQVQPPSSVTKHNISQLQNISASCCLKYAGHWFQDRKCLSPCYLLLGFMNLKSVCWKYNMKRQGQWRSPRSLGLPASTLRRCGGRCHQIPKTAVAPPPPPHILCVCVHCTRKMFAHWGKGWLVCMKSSQAGWARGPEPEEDALNNLVILKVHPKRLWGKKEKLPFSYLLNRILVGNWEPLIWF